MDSQAVKALILGIATGLAGLVASLSPIGHALEESVGLQILFELRGPRPPPPEVVVVTTEKEPDDTQNLPKDLGKWPRTLHARLTEILARAGAAVIVFDVFFEDPRSPGEDASFADAMRRSGRTVLCERLRIETVPLAGKEGGAAAVSHGIERLTPPFPALARAAVANAPFVLPKVPVKVSQYWTFKKGAGNAPTLPVVAHQIFAADAYRDFVRLLAKVSPDRAAALPPDSEALLGARGVEETVRAIREIFEIEPGVADAALRELEPARSPSLDPARRRLLRSLVGMYAGEDRRYLNFYGPPRTIATLPYRRILASGRGSGGGSPPFDFRGKAVFVGSSHLTQTEQKDGFYTVYSQASGLDVSGIEIAATAFANLAEEAHIRPPRIAFLAAVVFFWGLTIGVLCRLLPPLPAAAGTACLCALYILAAAHDFKTGGWIPLFVPLSLQAPLAFSASLAWRYVDVSRERRNIRKAFGYYLPNAAVDQLAKSISSLQAGNQLVYGICLNTDAERYTLLSETMEPKELGRLMNRYYEAVFNPVRDHGGLVSNVVADSMLALWVATDPDPDLKNRACRAALAIAGTIDRFNRDAVAGPLPTRIGLHSGHILLGNIGAVDHYEYRPTGDIVNTATRIEGLNKHLGTRILLSGDMVRRLDGFLTREVGEFLLAGKTRSIVVHELIGLEDEADAHRRAACALFARALEAFRAQRWEEAAGTFRAVADALGGDGPSRFYAGLCDEYGRNPPRESWDGVIRMERK